MSQRLKPISLYPLSVEDALAALVRIPPPAKTAKPAKNRRVGTTKKKPKR